LLELCVSGAELLELELERFVGGGIFRKELELLLLESQQLGLEFELSLLADRLLFLLLPCLLLLELLLELSLLFLVV